MIKFAYSKFLEFLLGPHCLKKLWRYYYFLLNFLWYKEISPSCFVAYSARVIRKSEIILSPRVYIDEYSNLAGCINIGKNSFVGPFCTIYGNVVLGTDVMMGPGSAILGGNYGFRSRSLPFRLQKNSVKGIRIGNNVWIGANTCILDGSIVGNNVVIGANVTVSGVVPPDSIVKGFRVLNIDPIVYE